MALKLIFLVLALTCLYLATLSTSFYVYFNNDKESMGNYAMLSVIVFSVLFAILFNISSGIGTGGAMQ